MSVPYYCNSCQGILVEKYGHMISSKASHCSTKEARILVKIKVPEDKGHINATSQGQGPRGWEYFGATRWAQGPKRLSFYGCYYQLGGYLVGGGSLINEA